MNNEGPHLCVLLDLEWGTFMCYTLVNQTEHCSLFLFVVFIIFNFVLYLHSNKMIFSREKNIIFCLIIMPYKNDFQHSV